MSETLNWGIIGTGHIARKFAAALEESPTARLAAVGSRRQETADAFGQEYNAPNRHGDYQALIDDSSVDAVYIATPTPFTQNGPSAARTPANTRFVKNPWP